jgi:vitamin B12 transporter
VVNIITKGPGSEEKLSGTLSASYGERDTGDYRAEAYGKKGALGYYVSAGRIQTDGLRSFSSSSLNNVYTKLTYDVAEKSTMLFNFFYRKTRSGGGERAEDDLFFGDQTEQLYSRLAFHTSLDAHTALNFALWLSRQSSELSIGQFSTMSELQKNSFMERGYGGSADVTWKQGAHAVVAGIDLNNGTLETNAIVGGAQDLKKWAAFANDTIVLDRLTITPGIRFDHSNLFSDFTSPSLGVTYALAEKTLVRAYVARGFSDPTLVSLFGHTLLFTGNPSLGLEKVWSYQGGIETGALKYLWLKVSVFRHDIRDGIVDQTLPDNTFTAVNQNRIRRQGAEAEIRTLPLWNTLLQAGASWISTKNLDTGQDLQDVPHYTYSIAIKYDDEKSFKALLKGYYIWWNEPAVNNAKYSSMIFDLNIIKTFFRQKDRSLDAFLTAHNLFNGSQYFVDIYPNSKRWFEGGLRYKF